MKDLEDVVDQQDPKVTKDFKDLRDLMVLKEQGAEMGKWVQRVYKVHVDPQVLQAKTVLMENLVARELLEIKVKLDHLV